MKQRLYGTNGNLQFILGTGPRNCVILVPNSFRCRLPNCVIIFVTQVVSFSCYCMCELQLD